MVSGVDYFHRTWFGLDMPRKTEFDVPKEAIVETKFLPRGAAFLVVDVVCLSVVLQVQPSWPVWACSRRLRRHVALVLLLSALVGRGCA